VKREGGGRVGRAIVASVPFVVAALSVTAFGGGNDAGALLLLLAGVAFQAGVVVLRRRHRMFGVEFAAGLLLAGLLVGTITGPRTGVLLVMPAGFAYLFVGLALLQHEAVRERVRRALPRRRAPPDESATAVRRDLAALGLVLPACALALLLVPLATWTFPLRVGGHSATGEVPPRRDVGKPPQPDTQGLSGVAPPLPDKPDSSLQRPAHIEIRPWVQGMRAESIGALYLRGLPLVETGSDRWREDFSGLRPVADADDGDADEWCAVRRRPAGKDSLVLEVKQIVPELASTGELVLLGPAAETAFEVPRLRAKAGGPYLVARPPTNGPFEYRVEAVIPWLRPPLGTRVVRRAPVQVAGDDESAASSVLAEQARRATAGVRGDVDRVRAVMKALRTDFSYEKPDGPPDGGTSLAEFVAARRGTCMQFAKAGVVMLRHLGISARIGTGFLVVEWDDQRSAYVASGRDRHAWVEVEIEGSGWVIFDPTPAAPDEAAPPPNPPAPDEQPGRQPSEDGTSAPPPEPQDTGDSVRQAIADISRVLADLWRRVLAYWPWFAAAAVLAVALGARTMLARRRRLAGERPAGPAPRGSWESLVADLARRGHRRRRSQTASEFARAVAAAGGEPYAAFVPLTVRHEAARFGALDLTPDDESAIDSFRTSLPAR
jgi:transglutaminase superfamily protein/uncharacterized protein DUF4129